MCYHICQAENEFTCYESGSSNQARCIPCLRSIPLSSISRASGLSAILDSPPVRGAWTAEAAALETFRQNPNSGPIPVEEFHAVALAVEEDEYFARKRIFAQFVEHDNAEGVKALAQIAGTGGEADLDAVGEDHDCTGRAGWMRRMIPPPSSNSTSGPAETRRSGAAPS